MYNLPFEYDARLEDYDELLGYLTRIAASDVSVRVFVGRPPGRFPYFEARGKLRKGVDRSGERHGVFAINTDESRDEGGELTLHEKHFRGGRLRTFDGDDYFTLVVEMDDVVLHIQDTNSI